MRASIWIRCNYHQKSAIKSCLKLQLSASLSHLFLQASQAPAGVAVPVAATFHCHRPSQPRWLPVEAAIAVDTPWLCRNLFWHFWRGVFFWGWCQKDIQNISKHSCLTFYIAISLTYHSLRGMVSCCHGNVIWNCWKSVLDMMVSKRLEAGFLMVWAFGLSIRPGSTFSMKLSKARVQQQFATRCCCLLVLCSSFWLALKKLRRICPMELKHRVSSLDLCWNWTWFAMSDMADMAAPPVKHCHKRSRNDSQPMNQSHKAQAKCNSSSVLVFSSGTCKGKALFQTFRDFLPLILANFKLHCICVGVKS